MKNLSIKLFTLPWYVIALIFIGIALLASWLFKTVMNTDTTKIAGNAPSALKQVAKQYGVSYARDIERVLRLETNHFKSGQWLGTGTAGMESFGEEFPHGWGSLSEYSHMEGIPANWYFTKSYKENGTGKMKTFIGFRDTGVFVKFFAWFIKNKRGGDVVSWYMLPTASNADKRSKYRKSLNSITPKFV